MVLVICYINFHIIVWGLLDLCLFFRYIQKNSKSFGFLFTY